MDSKNSSLPEDRSQVSRLCRVCLTECEEMVHFHEELQKEKMEDTVSVIEALEKVTGIQVMGIVTILHFVYALSGDIFKYLLWWAIYIQGINLLH